jgi:hypothetical protein
MDSFFYRLALLLGLMLVSSLVDIYRHGAQATKYREYGFVIFTGLIGAGVGCVNDLITSSISPEYFILGKGLKEGPDLRTEAGLFGLQVGLSAGAIGGAICLYASRRKSTCPPLEFSRLLPMLWMPLAAAIVCGFVLPLAFSKFDPAQFAAKLDTILSPDKINRFRRVWWIRVGLYAGMVIGLTAMIIQSVKKRKHCPETRLSVS